MPRENEALPRLNAEGVGVQGLLGSLGCLLDLVRINAF